jgi:hypothetical protein
MPNSPAFLYDDHSRRVIVFWLARHKEEASEASQHHYPRPHARNPTRACCPQLPRTHLLGTSVNSPQPTLRTGGYSQRPEMFSEVQFPVESAMRRAVHTQGWLRRDSVRRRSRPCASERLRWGTQCNYSQWDPIQRRCRRYHYYCHRRPHTYMCLVGSSECILVCRVAVSPPPLARTPVPVGKEEYIPASS